MYFKQIFKDDPLLPEYINECKNRGFYNNSTLESLKFSHFEHSAFFGGIEEEKIKVFSGVHNFDYNNKRYWRVGFRGATLYDKTFTPVFSTNFRKASIQAGVIFTISMKWVESKFGDSEFIMTSNAINHSIDVAGRSHIVDKIAKRNRIKGCTLLYENIEYLYTIQNVWLLDKKVWYEDFNKYYKGIKYAE